MAELKLVSEYYCKHGKVYNSKSDAWNQDLEWRYALNFIIWETQKVFFSIYR